MNFLDIKPGEHFEVGTQKAYRFWRYSCIPYRHADVRLLSWVSDMHWHPGQFVEGTSPDIGEQGIHGFKTYAGMNQSFNCFYPQMELRSRVSGCDGVVFGSIEMWGVIWDHEKGYRAQFARPLDFFEAYGNRSEQALADLRAAWRFAG